jgi:hypothetical protein
VATARALSGRPEDSDRHHVETGHPFEVPRVSGRGVHAVSQSGRGNPGPRASAPFRSHRRPNGARVRTAIREERRNQLYTGKRAALPGKQRNAPGENRTLDLRLERLAVESDRS